MYDKPLPVIDAETRPFWDAAKAHKFVLQHCGDCGKYVHYPRAVCPHCNGRNMDWRDASGDGSVQSCVPWGIANGGCYQRTKPKPKNKEATLRGWTDGPFVSLDA